MSENEFAEAWKPVAGDRLEGVVEGIELIDPNGKGAYPCVLVRSADGSSVNVHAFHSVLRRELARRRPNVGDEITVTYLGKAEGGQYGEYHSYRVTGGQAREFNWDAELPAEERERYATQTAEPPIQSSPTTPIDGHGPLPSSREPTPQQAAERNFGTTPPF